MSAPPPDQPRPTILALPPELTIHIFSQLEADPVHLPKPGAAANILAPVTLGQVCHDWRTLSRETPELWTDLRVVLGGSEERQDWDVDAVAAFLFAWIDRSKTRGIRLSLRQDIEMYDNFPTSLIFTLLARSAPRLEALHLEHLPHACVKDLMDGTDHGVDVVALPALKSFHISDNNIESVFRQPCSYRNLQSSPLLTDFGIIARYSFMVPKPAEFAWGRITRLSVATLRRDDILLILGETKELVECTLRWDGRSHRALPVPNQIVLPKLERLVLESSLTALLLDRLILPRLWDLGISLAPGIVWLDDGVLPGLRPLAPRITRLAVRIPEGELPVQDSYILAPFLRAFPNVENFIFEAPDASQLLWHSLASSEPMPLLRMKKLRVETWQTPAYVPLVELLEERVQAGSCDSEEHREEYSCERVRSFELILHGAAASRPPAVDARLYALKESGMCLRIGRAQC
ncbi:hypothetical protein MKEN_01152300 [Mycena kentingensis (nom. inval.)]|nr:hypothetical protein MKEN_01152300 [Mycena kentingensis (nom. inval.)]